MQYLRESGTMKGGQKPMHDADRSLFQRELEKLIQSVKKHG
jgi:uncharacterized protein YaiI (UPF0178 family)